MLSQKQIKGRMLTVDYKKKLLITPLLSENQIGPDSIDIRLGTSIVIPRKTHINSYNVSEVTNMTTSNKNRLFDFVILKPYSKFVLHPRQLILGITFEYLSLPCDLFCTVISRSSWGRLGLTVANKGTIPPNHKGCLTLELVNLGETPITLYPGLLIAQLIFYPVKEEGRETADYEGSNKWSTYAKKPKLSQDKEFGFWYPANEPTI